MLLAHEHALFGFFDNESLRYVPGLLQRMDDVAKDQRRMLIVGGVIISLLLAIVTRQYALIPTFIGLFSGAK